jgi:predicted acetylornithine/succinylornithine family transaminase
MQVVNRMPPVLVRGEGTRVFDNDDNSYLDFTAGWAVLNLGHNHPAVTEAIRDQAGKILQMSNLFYTTPQLSLAKIIVDNSAVDRVFFCNSGAEANEGACKVARKWGKIKLDGAYEIITALDSFHGRTQAMMAATGQPAYQENWKPLMPGFVNVHYNDVEAIKGAYVEGRTCAVLLEPVQGEGGVNIPSANYLKDVMDFCHEKNILFMLDEVQTGLGRTGRWFGFHHAGIRADIVTVAKALGNGVPIGAVWASAEVAAAFSPGDHGSTFGGQPLAASAAREVLRVMEEIDAPACAAVRGAALTSLLAALPGVTAVRGLGLLLAAELDPDVLDGRTGADVARACLDAGLVVNGITPTALRLAPPLTVTDDELVEGVAILGAVLSEDREAIA